MTFNKYPSVRVNGSEKTFAQGWENINTQLLQSINGKPNATIVVECYQGVHQNEIMNGLNGFDHVFDSRKAFKSEEEILKLTYPDVTDDRIFGVISNLNMEHFIDDKKAIQLAREIAEAPYGTKLVIGPGASHIMEYHDVLVYADMARWEIQLRMRKNEVPNLGLHNCNDTFERQYKIGYFVDWRVCDKLKNQLMQKWDYVLDTNKPNDPKLATGKSINQTLKSAVNQPFSVVPFFDPGPWGGQWMKDVCNLDKSQDNFAWCFNCVPEENSLLIEYDNGLFEIPSINLVFQQPEALLGKSVYERFGAEFPIRFDFLDTIDGGNLSLQVHPLTHYIKDKFGVEYTQDESYYMMDASEEATVYLGLQENTNSDEMIDALKEAQSSGKIFDADSYAKAWPAKKHDHFLIPAGTVHCSGEGCMVLEISATPYIFTFKLWDWGRVGLDGKPRPINIEHGEQVIQWDRKPEWTEKNLINRIEEVAIGDGWKEEKTGLHELEFIETRRFWFTKQVFNDTNGTVNVLCLVEGEQVVVESPDNAFEPFLVNYAEVFIVPAAVGKYTISPVKETNKEYGIIKAYIR